MPSDSRRGRPPRESWERLRLTDRLRPGVRVLFVGINPGIRSAMTGHHFAGFSNRFWKLLHESGLVPRPATCEDDVCFPDWGYGVTNLVARPSPGIDGLTPADYLAGRDALEKKIRRFRPEIVALVGVTLYRALFPKKGPIELGLQEEHIHGARVFVLPNPSGRNANYTYAEMLGAFRGLASVAAPGSSARRLKRGARGDRGDG
jgi:TDG/mug DNA glycosylase family protein